MKVKAADAKAARDAALAVLLARGALVDTRGGRRIVARSGDLSLVLRNPLHAEPPAQWSLLAPADPHPWRAQVLVCGAVVASMRWAEGSAVTVQRWLPGGWLAELNAWAAACTALPPPPAPAPAAPARRSPGKAGKGRKRRKGSPAPADA